MGLSLPTDVGMSEREAEAREKAWSTVDRVDARMTANGLGTIPVPDVECPVIDAAILLSTDFVQYTTAYAAQLRWYNYVVQLVAEARATLLEIDNAMDDIASAKRLAFKKANAAQTKRDDKMNALEMSDHVQQDPAYKALKFNRQVLEQERIKLDARADMLERNLKTVSRQIENRKMESQGGNREANLPGAGSGAWENRQQRRMGG